MQLTCVSCELIYWNVVTVHCFVHPVKPCFVWQSISVFVLQICSSVRHNKQQQQQQKQFCAFQVCRNFTSCLLLISWPSLLMSGNWICDNLSFVNLCFTLMLSCWWDIYKCSGEFMMITTGGLAMSQECTCHLLDSTWPPDITYLLAAPRNNPSNSWQL